jgi:hypothetical protein
MSAKTLQYEGRVTVGDDGNGVTVDQFPTTVAGDKVRYFLRVGIDGDAAPVTGLTVTLNEDVVFQSEDDVPRVEVALDPIGPSMNSIVAAAHGSAGSAARVVIVAVQPRAVPLAGLSVLPSARADDLVRTILTVHNVDAAEIGVRLAFFDPDGTLSGRTDPQRLVRHATVNLNLNAVAASLGLGWTGGAVHVEWLARGPSRISTVATEERFGQDGDASRPPIAVRTLALDDYPPCPVAAADAAAFLGTH